MRFHTHTPSPPAMTSFATSWREDLGDFLPSNIRQLAGESILNTTVLALNLARAATGEPAPRRNIAADVSGVRYRVHHKRRTPLSWTGPEFKALFDKYIPKWRHDPQQLADISLYSGQRHTRKPR